MNDLEELADFLDVRIGDEEWGAKVAIADDDAAHIAHLNARRVLAECATKRDIVAHLRVAIHRDAVALEDLKRCGPDDPRAGAYHLAAITVLEVVTCIAEHAALIYADHPNYNEDWTPENSVAEDMP